MEWIVLVIATFIYFVCCYLTYREDLRSQWWYIPLGVVLGMVLTGMWFAITRHIGDKQRIYVFSLFWDTAMWGIYYILPLLFFGVKLDRWTGLGLALIIAGLFIVKVKG